MAPDPSDSMELGLKMTLRSRPLDDAIAARRSVAMIYPCIVEAYTPRPNRVSRPLNDPASGQETDVAMMLMGYVTHLHPDGAEAMIELVK